MDLPMIDGFTFQTKLLSSSRSTLWRARQDALDRDVLIALFDPEVVADTELCHALFGAIRAMIGVRTSIFPEIIDMVSTEEEAYLILEDSHAKNVVELLTNSRLDAQQLFQLAIGLTEGFAELHAAHLVYGGLRPKVLYISEDYGPLLTDLSTVSFETGYGERIPEDSIVGSVSYIAPEVYLDPESVDTRADMFALGMTLYSLATGQVPYGALSAEEILEAKQTMTIPSPCDISPNFPPALADILVKLAQRDPEDRYADWDELRYDLHQAQRGIPPEVSSPETSVIAPPNPLARAKAGRTIRLSVSDLRAYRQSRNKPKDRSKLLIGIICALVLVVLGLIGVVVWMSLR